MTTFQRSSCSAGILPANHGAGILPANDGAGVPPAADKVQARRLRRPRRGISLMEVTVTSGLTVFLAVLLSSTWALLNRPTAGLIAWGQIFQEMDLATASIARDVGGGLSDYANAGSPLGNKQQGACSGAGTPMISTATTCNCVSTGRTRQVRPNGTRLPKRSSTITSATARTF